MPDQLPTSPATRRAPSKRDKFFEMGVRGSAGTRTPTYYTQRTPKMGPLELQISVTEPTTFHIAPSNALNSAHFGYIYAMALLPSHHLSATDPPRLDGAAELLTGSGDADVRLWLCTPHDGPVLQHTFSAGEGGGVLSLVARAGTVYAGCQAGFVKVWDVETRTLVRTIIAQENVDVLSLSMLGNDLYGCSANGMLQRWDSAFECKAAWKAHDGIVLSSIITGDLDPTSARYALVTGANDNTIRLWSVDKPTPIPSADIVAEQKPDTLLRALEQFVALPSVSGCEGRREHCRQAAIWLKKCLSQLGAEASLLPTLDASGTEKACGNPLVLATFRGTGGSDRPRPRILFYG